MKTTDIKKILELIQDYEGYQRHLARQHYGAAEQMYLNKAAAARDLTRTITEQEEANNESPNRTNHHPPTNPQ